ncbi:CvpA family protein [Aquicella siphonis]|nr:CvpA family protein [Aquicella siphonis]
MGSLNVGSLNVVDIVILAIFLISILIGFGRGLVSEVLSLLTLIAAFVIAILFANTLAVYLTHTATVQNLVSQTSGTSGASTSEPVSYMALGVSFGILFVATVFVGMVVKMLLNLMLHTGILGFGNRILGGIFGLGRGYLINLVIIFLVQLSPMASQSWWQQSQYVPKFQSQVVWLGNTVSPALENLKSTFGSAVGSAMDEVQGAVQNMGNAMQEVPASKPADKSDTAKPDKTEAKPKQ